MEIRHLQTIEQVSGKFKLPYRCLQILVSSPARILSPRAHLEHAYRLASVRTGTVSNSSAIGALAEVDQDNSMVLGSINGVNFATADTNVNIGYDCARARLHIGLANSTGLRIEGPSVAGTGVAAPFIVGGRFSVKEMDS